MFRIDNSTVAATQPAPTPVGTPGFFTDGSAGGGVPATVVSAEFLNCIQEELVSAVVAAGLALSKTSFNQLASAIRSTCPAVGTMRSGFMLVPTASATALFGADQVVVATALGGNTFLVNTISLSCNLASVGAGGMDSGTAPVSGFVGLYLIYNPVSGARALLAVNAGPAVLPQVYGGSHMPTGFTASALVSVWPTTASGLFDVGSQIDRTINHLSKAVIVSNLAQNTLVSATTTVFPKNATRVTGSISIQSTAPSSMNMSLYSAGVAVGQQTLQLVVTANQALVGNVCDITIATPQTIFWTSGSSAGTPTFGFNVTSFNF